MNVRRHGPYRILMTWMYRHTGSVFVAILMHGAYTGGQILLQPIGASQPQNLIWWALFGLILTAAVGLVALGDRAHPWLVQWVGLEAVCTRQRDSACVQALTLL